MVFRDQLKMVKFIGEVWYREISHLIFPVLNTDNEFELVIKNLLGFEIESEMLLLGATMD